MMTSRDRLLQALERRVPDRLPVTTHHLMTSFLDRYLHGLSSTEFFERFGMDAIHWTLPLKGGRAEKLLEIDWIDTPDWHVIKEAVPHPEFDTHRYRFVTPKGELSMVLQANEHTAWITEHLIKEKRDIDLIGEFCPAPACDVDKVNRQAAEFGDRGIVRGHIVCFDVYGQPGCWQDAACLVGIEKLILETYDDPAWVHALLKILQRRKLAFAHSLKGAKFDILELGGGDASATVISPPIFDEFVAPYDSPIIAAAHAAGQRIAYHTCGGMMPFLERIAAMQPDAMETLTPDAMGGDMNLAEAKRRIGDKVCLIGGFDQLHFFTGCTPEQTRAEVRRCFREAGQGGGFILSPSDHFFEADLALLEAFADEACRCVY